MVLIGCPPNLGLITLSGLRIADGYVIPTIPDVLSTYGIPQILNHVERFATDIQELIGPLWHCHLPILYARYCAPECLLPTAAIRMREVGNAADGPRPCDP